MLVKRANPNLMPSQNSRIKITEQIGGTSKGKSDYDPSPVVAYRYDGSRKSTADDIYDLWKQNPIVQSRVLQMNNLVFGKGIQYDYPDEATKKIIDRLWRINRLQSKLDKIGTNSQLYGELYVGLFPQKSGDILLSFYEPRQVDIDFDPSDPTRVNAYLLSWKDEEKGVDNIVELQPVEAFINEIEFANPITNGKVNLAKKQLGQKLYKGKGLMTHIYFNSTASELCGTSDFYQGSDLVQDFMGFVGDRLTIHQLYGSPVYDITIDTNDPRVIENRIEELQDFRIGSNPVHNKQEEWKLLNAQSGNGNGSVNSEQDADLLKSLIACSLCMPSGLLFQDKSDTDLDTTSVEQLAEKRQEAFRQLFTDIHKVAVAIAGGDIYMIDDGEITFPEISLTSSKTKAETSALLVQSNIISRQTASSGLGYSWEREKNRMLDENQEMGDIINVELEKQKMAGMASGGLGQTSKTGQSNTSRDKNQRTNPSNVKKTSRPMSNRKDDSTTKVGGK